MPSQPDPQYLSVREAARRLGVHENTVRNWSKSGLLEAVRLPETRYRRFRADDVDRLRHDRERERAKKSTKSPVGPEFADAEFLDAWEGRRAQELLPHLVRRLIVASPGVLGLDMRSGDGVGAPGWDAVIEESPGTAWIPRGASRWELGTGADPRAKAQDDYRRRVENPLGAEPSRTTFVFVTQRRWPNAQDWERRRKEEGVWRDVRVIDADQLAAWLEATPEVHLWFSEKVGLQPLEVRTLEGWWERFSRQTRPKLSPQLVLSGRQEVTEELITALGTAPAAIGVRSRSREEAVSFLAASLIERRDEITHPVVVARSAKGFERLCWSQGSMIIVVDTDDEIDASEAVARGHRVILPVKPGDAASMRLLDVPQLERTAAGQALEEMGLPFDLAYRLAGLARRSFPAFLRHPELAIGSRSSPPWGRGRDAPVLAPLVLVGAWAPSEPDQAIVAQVANRKWDDLEPQLRTWARTDDPPFVEVGGEWRVASPEGAWAVLFDALSASQLRRFRTAAVKVLGEEDPVYSLPADEREYAGFRGVQRQYSPTLRRGVAQGLALLGAFGDELVLPDGSTGRSYAASVIGEILSAANDDEAGLRWRSLSDQLPLLAEAAPETFLAAIERGLDGDAPVLRTMFMDGESGSALFSSSPHTGLLWALEVLCWPAEHLASAAIALAKLAEVDPGGQFANRPAASLRDVFLSWFPQTSASLEDRFRVLDQLERRHPAISWKLNLALLPKTHDTASPSSTPRFRPWVPAEKGVGIQERMEMAAELAHRLIKAAGQDMGKWSELVEHLGNLPHEQRNEMLSALEHLDSTESEDRLKLWRALIDETARHRAFPEARWSMGDDSLVRLEAIAAKIEPDQLVERHARLFDWRPELGEADRKDYASWERAVSSQRATAAKETIEHSGYEGLVRLADASVLPRQVGVSAAEVAGDALREQMLGAVDRDGARGEMSGGWIAYMAHTHGADWIEAGVGEFAKQPVEKQTAFFLALPPRAAVWQLLEAVPAAVIEKYWAEANPLLADREDVAIAVRHLLDHGRPWVAIDLLSVHCRPGKGAEGDLPPELVRAALERALSEGSTADRARASSLGYEIGVLLDYLEETGTQADVLARLEWGYFPLLEDGRREPSALYKGLAQDPELFVELVSRVFRGKNEPREERSEDDARVVLARHSWHVLNAWRRVPGADENGKIDAGHLRAWVRQVRLMLEERDRVDIGDQQIGQLLSGSTPGRDGAWPAEPVRDVIEEIGSSDLDTGLRIGRYNARGVTSRGPYAGGDQERDLSEQYAGWASQVKDKWPRTARVLKQLADEYEREARLEDARAHRDAAGD